MEIKDYIHVMEGKLPHQLCDDILKEYVLTHEWKPGTIGGEGVYEDIRKCDSIYMSHNDVINANPKVRQGLDQGVFESIAVAIGTYLSKFGTFKCNIEKDSGYSLLRYKTGDFIGQHIDASGRSPRELSCSVALNDNYEGGEFAFFNKKLKVRLKKGDIIMFPSNFMFPHEILPITSGIRYSLITWIC
jgi:hypothetical protein